MDVRRSFDPMYGPAGRTAILRSAIRSCAPGQAWFTLEIHQAEGRLPLGDTGLFGHWRDLTNADRDELLARGARDNHLLAPSALAPRG